MTGISQHGERSTVCRKALYATEGHVLFPFIDGNPEKVANNSCNTFAHHGRRADKQCCKQVSAQAVRPAAQFPSSLTRSQAVHSCYQSNSSCGAAVCNYGQSLSDMFSLCEVAEPLSSEPRPKAPPPHPGKKQMHDWYLQTVLYGEARHSVQRIPKLARLSSTHLSRDTRRS